MTYHVSRPISMFYSCKAMIDICRLEFRIDVEIRIVRLSTSQLYVYINSTLIN
jgi:hypothetical protein